MSRTTKTYITLTDGRQYSFPTEEGDVLPEIWEVQINITRLDERGNKVSYGSVPLETVHVDRQLLFKHGVITLNRLEAQAGKEPQPKSVEDLLLELLESLGVYPQE